MTQLTPAQAFNEAQRLLRMGDYPRAGSLTQQLVQNLPDEPIIRGLHGATLARMGRLAPGLGMMQDALDKAEQERFKTFMAVECSTVLRRLNRLDEALEMAERAVGFEPDNPEARGAKGEALVDLGRFDEAKAFLATPADDDTAGPALAWGRACLLSGDAAAGVGRVAAAAGRVGVSAVELERLLRLLGQLCERTGRDDQAFDAWRRAARLKKAEFDTDAHRKLVDNMIAQWTPEALAKIAGPADGGERSVILVGSPGAGHELVEAVIASHPGAFGLGDLGILAHVCRKDLEAEKTPFGRIVVQPGRLKGRQLADGAATYAEEVGGVAPEGVTRVVDAQVHNFYHAGVVRLMLPGARIVLCTRDPQESALACFAAVSGAPYARDLEELGRYTADAQRLCIHWKNLLAATGAKVHEVRTEDLAGDTERTARSLFDFLDLEFDGRCLTPEKHANLRTPPGDEARLPMSAQIQARAERFAGRTKALRTGLENE